MDLSKYLLSSAVAQRLEIVGLKIEDQERTIDLRERARFFVKLVTEGTAKTKAQLLTRLASLKVWGVPAIKLTQEVHYSEFTEDTSGPLFDDIDGSKLEIYLPLKDLEKAVVDFELSEGFIRYCHITDHIFQKLVSPILQYPKEKIEKLLEEYGLDEPGVVNDESTDLQKPISEERNNDSEIDESAPIFQNDAGTIPSPRTPSFEMKDVVQESNSQISRPSSLRDRIPSLDQNILSIREAAALPSTTPTLLITPSRLRTNYAPSLGSTASDTQDVHDSTAGNESFSARNLMYETEQSTSSVEPEAETQTPHDAFEFRNFHSEFSEVFGLDSTSRDTPTTSTQYHSAPRYSRSSRGPRTEPDPERTMHGLQLQKIGLLGETFINGWLSSRLRDWDPTLHWTSRNRNYLYPNSPFKGKEADFADFTYPDTNGELTHLLKKFIFPYNTETETETWSSKPPTYHLEVKSTSESCNEPFYMSNNQVHKAREWTIQNPRDNHIVSKDIYVVIRVYNLDRGQMKPGFTAYVDPWAMYLARQLEFLAREDYSVTPVEPKGAN